MYVFGLTFIFTILYFSYNMPADTQANHLMVSDYHIFKLLAKVVIWAS